PGSSPEPAVDGHRCCCLDEPAFGTSRLVWVRVELSGQTQTQPVGTSAPPCPGQSRGARDLQKKLRPLLRAVATAFPQAKVELWAMDEHRIGLKPLLRRVWAPKGQRPTALVRHRFAWRYIVGFVHPASGRTLFHLATSVSIALFEVELAAFAHAAGAS